MTAALIPLPDMPPIFETLMIWVVLFGPYVMAILALRRWRRLHAVIGAMLRAEHQAVVLLLALAQRAEKGDGQVAVTTADLEPIGRALFVTLDTLKADAADPLGLRPWRIRRKEPEAL